MKMSKQTSSPSASEPGSGSKPVTPLRLARGFPRASFFLRGTMRSLIALLLLALALPAPALALDPAVVRSMPVTEQDEKILLRTGELLRDETQWNRQDERWCEDDEQTGKRSLFCALHRATVDVLGKY